MSDCNHDFDSNEDSNYCAHGCGEKWSIYTIKHLQSELANKDELLRECEEALVHYSHINFVEGQDWTLKAKFMLQKLRRRKERNSNITAPKDEEQ